MRGVETQPEYIPHITIAYLKHGEGKRFRGDRSFEGKQFVADSVMFMPKDGSRPVNIPLGVNEPAVEEQGSRLEGGFDQELERKAIASSSATTAHY